MTPLRNYHQLRSDWLSVKQTLSMAAALPRFFRERITLERAEEEIKKLLDTRPRRFLELARSLVYPTLAQSVSPSSPACRLRIFRSRARSGPSWFGRNPAETGSGGCVRDLGRVQGKDRNSAWRTGVSRLARGFRAPGFMAGLYDGKQRHPQSACQNLQLTRIARALHSKRRLSSMEPMTCSPAPAPFTSRC